MRVREVAAAHDVGTVLHRAALEGQVEGGVVQAMGWAVSEELHLERGRLLNPNFTDYVHARPPPTRPRFGSRCSRASAAAGPLGAKGVGEPSFIPTAAAVRNAVVAALGVELDRLPMTPPARGRRPRREPPLRLGPRPGPGGRAPLTS